METPDTAPVMENISRLLDIMARLRDPQHGCPWDLKQTFDSIAAHTLEEAYEVVDAIERDNFADLEEELGDLLLQVVYYTQMADEQDLFDFDTVAKGIADKLIRRHPHVFADASLASDAELAAAWESEKARERNIKQGRQSPASVMDGVAKALPELMRADKLQKRAARVGFDWPETNEIFFKIEEEFGEVQDVLSRNEGNVRLEEEIGDLLFAIVNLSRHVGIPPESALRRANQKFERRFRAIEDRLAQQGRAPNECTLAQLDALWDEVKKQPTSQRERKD